MKKQIGISLVALATTAVLVVGICVGIRYRDRVWAMNFFGTVNDWEPEKTENEVAVSNPSPTDWEDDYY